MGMTRMSTSLTQTIQLRAGADVKIALRDGDAGTETRIVAFVLEVYLVQQFERIAAGLHHGDVAVEIHHVDLAIRRGGRALEDGATAQISTPHDGTVRRLDAVEFTLRAIENVEALPIKKGRGLVGGHIALPDRRCGISGILNLLHVALPREIPRRERAIAARFHRVDRSVFRTTCQDDAGSRGRR